MNDKIKILLADGDSSLATILAAYLEQRDYSTTIASNGEQAIEYFQKETFDFCILEVNLQERDGFDVAEEIRTLESAMPILFLSSRVNDEDKFKAFEAGADDYVTKPFNMDELMYRIAAILRRTRHDETNRTIFSLGLFDFDSARQSLVFDKTHERKLTAKESDLLRLFAANLDKVIERKYALQKVWKDRSFYNARSMDVYVTKLRKYLSVDPSVELLNVHGVGFRLVVREGRRKTIPIQEGVPLIQVSEKKKRGRKPKEKPEPPIDKRTMYRHGFKMIPDSTPKRKRGRPRKNG